MEEEGTGAREEERIKARIERAGPGLETGPSEKTSLEVTFVCYSRGLCL